MPSPSRRGLRLAARFTWHWEMLESRVLLSSTGLNQPLSSVPQLNSLPGAHAKLYLDFVGDTTPTWGKYHPGITPAMDFDGDPTSFSDSERAKIQEIWARVSEKYAPFNLNVTTVDPGNLNDKETLRVVIGGSGAWTGSDWAGLTYLGSFTNSDATYGINKAFVFSAQLYANTKYIAEAAAHEAGHGFGLSHQSSYTGTSKTEEYNPGDSLIAPIMGESNYSTRGLWFKGPDSDGYNVIQDDLSILSNSANGFGYRTDDRGDDLAHATMLDMTALTVTGSGIIEKNTDTDVFSFTAMSGTVQLTVSPFATGGMLNADMELYNANGTQMAASDTDSLSETLTTYLPEGTYYLKVHGHGNYGDLGQYTLSGTVPFNRNKAPQPAIFDESFYLQAYPDVANAVHAGALASGWDHFFHYGAQEMRKPDLYFDAHYYLTKYPDVAAAVANGSCVSAFDHYWSTGQKNGLNPCAFFDEAYYLRTNTDVAAAVSRGQLSSGFEHFLAYGQKEGRSPNRYFSESYYLQTNPDVAAAVKAGSLVSGFAHYIQYGAKEGRNPSSLFQESYYLARYLDVAAAVKAGSLLSGLEHYLLYGLSEGRIVHA